ncbi:FAD/NAD(P)-binding protein [Allostreptomyces psammosilenae]|uniref:Putative NAD(P)/FAD-binding protein YdhS n=1 Tax=Allostreptomyces psammosilenae TaxID=1892865 RepID=A0A853A0J9_9ACTN|nr:FAD/NAD(P)-binding protein [Allostreptomyces psammosilenae]NYI04341.1 putative NAD(P)/FAD-binding protein YdhS [Allostreptomyces psammosilenae]
MAVDRSTPLVVCVVGAGPRGTSLLERLIANAPRALGDRPLVVHVVDPFPPGPGRTWREEQHPLLWMNSVAADISMFPEPAPALHGPVRPGPSLAHWVLENREELARDPLVGEEVRRFTEHSFASRPLAGRYLRWVFERVVAEAPPGVRIRVHRASAVDLGWTDGHPRRQVVRLDDGSEPLLADAVVLSQGYLDVPADREGDPLARFAAEHGLGHLPPAYTADAALDDIPAGEPVLVRGLGLAFVDLMVLLAEGRGGRYEREGDGTLRYRPSGREPILYVGSRRGVPYHAKLSYLLPGGPPPLPRYFTPEMFPPRDGGAPPDFRADVWPHILKELAGAHLYELFSSHPERTTVERERFLARYAELPWGSPELTSWIAEAVPDPADRFDPEALDRPLAGERFASAEELQERLREYVRGDLERRGDVRHSADAAVFAALLSVYGVLARLVQQGALPPSAVSSDVEGWFHGFFSYLASGPPPQRLEQLLALSRAGVVCFLGPEVRITGDGRLGVFQATAAGVPGAVRARWLVEARLPEPDAARTSDPLLRALRHRGELREQVIEAESGPERAGAPSRRGPSPTGRLLTDSAQRLLRADGTVQPGRYAIGHWVAGGAWSGGFPRPGVGVGFAAQNDALARTVLAEAAARTAVEPAVAAVEPGGEAVDGAVSRERERERERGEAELEPSRAPVA